MSLAVKLSSQCVRKHKWEYDDIFIEWIKRVKIKFHTKVFQKMSRQSHSFTYGHSEFETCI